MCRSQNIITSVSTIEGNFFLNDYYFRGTGQYYVTVCIIQSFQKLFITPFVKFHSPYQDSHMQIIGLVETLIITKPLPDTAPGICNFFFFKCTTAMWSGKKNVILTMRPFVDQSKPDSHFDSQIDPHILCILIHSTSNTNAKGGTQYPAPGEILPSTNVWYPPKIGFQIPWWRNGRRIE